MPAQQRADDDIVLNAESAGNGRTIWKVRPMPRRQMRVGRQAVDAFAVEADRAGVGRKHAGDHVEQRGLAGAVGTDQREDRAGRHLEAHVVDREQAAKALADGVDSRAAALICRAPSGRGACDSHGQTPSGSRDDHQQQAEP